MIQRHEHVDKSGELQDLLMPYFPTTENMAWGLREAFSHQLENENISLLVNKNMPQADKDIFHKGSLERFPEADLRSYNRFVGKFEDFRS